MSDLLLSTDSTSQIYLDANATTPVLPCIAEVVSHTMQICFGNPSSSHITGIQAKHLLEQTRNRARAVIGAHDGDILFTSGATEGIQTAVVSTLIAAKNHSIDKPVLLYGATEHKAVPNTLIHWNEVLGINAQVLAIPVSSEGILDLDFIAQHADKALMICTMAVNNETGVYQDLTAIEAVIRAKNTDVAWMVDCVQALGKTALELSTTTIDYAPFSGHKLYAPKGIGVLYIRQGSAYTPFIAGGGQESGMRSGTENLPGIAGLNKLFNLLLDETDDTFKPLSVLHDYREKLHNALQYTFGQLTFNHKFENSVPTTLNFSVNELSSKEVMDLFDAAGIRISGGSACSSGASRSFVLDAMGKSNWQSENALRLSFGPATTQTDINFACERIRSLKSILQANCLIVSDSESPQQEACALGLTQYRHQGACCWLYVTSQHQAVIIDPIAELLPRLEKIVTTQKLQVVAILDTHAHQDRMSSVELFKAALSAHLNFCGSDQLGWPAASSVIELGQTRVERIATPGHSIDSFSYMLRCNKTSKVLYCFCGDLLLPAGLGNTSLKGGSAVQMAESLVKLNNALAEESIICSGHDYQQCFAINWQTQIIQTPLLFALLNNQISVVEFADQKSAHDTQSTGKFASLCGYAAKLDSFSASQVDIVHAKALLNDANAYLIDTREPYEHGVTALPHLFNIDKHRVINIPLSRMANACADGQLDKSRRYVLLCRSGNRSKQAAANLTQLGFEQVYNLDGGMALL
ncbi:MULTISPECIES: aminotransferase class V-fold PLP-dependent enzyme [unclassified Pseudoalteromonas]|uniref:aminotransferase class V-fold PLP-dependent enzyme n=1 Tax=unclassified Pseudoalteromonas TaxID=194690 RepID=UPI0025B5A271|nr:MULTISPECIES: aminotransferase class V-fold PLP-dependent enzyme [unclassified Pseudoalteromonas]MDN3380626.1 aminotransferase class V-fold PLP-dependent enzyme [Pseudoalteromonas sp. APC 3893]MDN3389013.1 aminotransferase class V-fold PLP-dependent enzyme [Pseudoalteromonas sp. APC 4017]